MVVEIRQVQGMNRDEWQSLEMMQKAFCTVNEEDMGKEVGEWGGNDLPRQDRRENLE